MSSGICIMQTCTAMQLPTSRLGDKTKGTVSLNWLNSAGCQLPPIFIICAHNLHTSG